MKTKKKKKKIKSNYNWGEGGKSKQKPLTKYFAGGGTGQLPPGSAHVSHYKFHTYFMINNDHIRLSSKKNIYNYHISYVGNIRISFNYS